MVPICLGVGRFGIRLVSRPFSPQENSVFLFILVFIPSLVCWSIQLMDGLGLLEPFVLWWCEGMIQSCWLVRRTGYRNDLQRFSGPQEATERGQKAEKDTQRSQVW